MAVTDVTSLSISKYQLGIQVTKITDSSADWASVANNTYFYDKGDQLVHYKNSGGTVLEIFSAGGLTYFTEAENTSAPNGTVYVDSLTAAASSTDADAAFVPKGAGALIAAVPNNLTSGGNKRGQYAVDWQMLRNANTRVASGNRSVIIGGYNNSATNTYSIVGGESNQSLGYGSVVFGTSNTANDTTGVAIGNNNNISGQSSVGLGESNTIGAGRNYAFAAGGNNTINGSGQYQTALGYNNTVSNNVNVGIGYQNTSSGATAVAIGQQNISSGQNATAIGKSNTSSSTSASTLGESNIASGAYSTAIGNSNTTNGTRGLAFGYANTSSNDNALCLGGVNTASASESVALGNRNIASGASSLAYGFYANTFGIYGRKSYASGQESTAGDSQASKFVLHERTTDATATTLTTNSSAAGTTNQVILSNQSAYRFKGTIIGKKSGTTDIAAWDVDGLIVRGANAAATTLAVSNVTLVQNTPAWGTPTLAADTTNGGLQVQVTGAASTNIQWTATIETTEVIYA